MLVHVRQAGLSAWITLLVAASLVLGGLATLFTNDAFHWPAVVAGLVIAGIQIGVSRNAIAQKRAGNRSA